MLLLCTKVVECLSEIVRNDTLTDARHRIPRDCRQQLKTQLLQQRESVDLDPKLLEMCGLDIVKLCPHVKRENAQVLCLYVLKFLYFGYCLACRF